MAGAGRAGRALGGLHGPAAQLGAARLGTAEHGSARRRSARLGSAQLRSARLSSDRLGGELEAAPPSGRAASSHRRQPPRPMAGRAGRGGPLAPPAAGRARGAAPARRSASRLRRAGLQGAAGAVRARPGPGAVLPRPPRGLPARRQRELIRKPASPLLAAVAGLCRGAQPRVPLPWRRVHSSRRGDEQGRTPGARGAYPGRAVFVQRPRTARSLWATTGFDVRLKSHQQRRARGRTRAVSQGPAAGLQASGWPG